MIKNKKILLAILLVVIYCLLGALLISFVPENSFCVLYLIQSILIPILATRYLIRDITVFYHSNLKRVGPWIGILSGLLPTTLMIFVPIILIYINGGERTDLNSKLAFGTIALSGIVAWLGLISLSAFVGYLTAIPFSKDNTIDAN
jgi:hypothetical protein